MKTLISILTLTTVLFISVAQANTVSNSGQAVTLCKQEAQTQHSDYRRSKSSSIKNTRSGYRIDLKVYTDEGSVKSRCNIARDGSLEYALK